jgi:hypothetical protein
VFKKCKIIFFILAVVSRIDGMEYITKALIYLFPNAYIHAFARAASRSRNYKQLKKLLDAGMPVNIHCFEDLTALYLAILGHNTRGVKLLLDFYADPNCYIHSRKTFPLMYACSEGQKDVVEILLISGADVDMKDHNGKTAVFLATCQGSLSLLELLLLYGADSTCKDNNGHEPLYYAEHMDAKTNLEILEKNRRIEFLQENQFLFRAAENPTRPQFTTAIEKGRYGFVKLLMKKGSIPQEEDILVAKKKYEQMVKQQEEEFSLRCNDIFINAHRMIGVQLIKFLRFVGPYGSKSYGPISKKGMSGIFPSDIVKLIALFASV